MFCSVVLCCGCSRLIMVNNMFQGLLVDLSKKAMITQNYKELDDTIYMHPHLVQPYRLESL